MERNYFCHRTAAERYRKYRPDLIHRLVLARARELCGARAQRALDVACGTGQSTVPLTELAQEVVGVDMSAAMIAEAPRHARVRYEVGLAEDLAFAAGSFDLVTTALALHWFDRRAFLDEVFRVLKPGGWLVVYTNGMTGRMGDHAGFEPWFRDRYLARYPGTPRHATSLQDEECDDGRLALVERAQYRDAVVLSTEEIVGFLLTQSNVIARVELGDESIEAASRWVTQSLRETIGEHGGALEFSGRAEFLRRR